MIPSSILGIMCRFWPANRGQQAWLRHAPTWHNGAPFKNWVLPSGLARVRRKLRGSNDGDRQMAKVLAAVQTDGHSNVEVACAEALDQGTHSADVILNILSRKRVTPPPMTIMTPEALRLRHVPIADCTRYDSLRRID
jgi:hypothetical protein